MIGASSTARKHTRVADVDQLVELLGPCDPVLGDLRQGVLPRGVDPGLGVERVVVPLIIIFFSTWDFAS